MVISHNLSAMNAQRQFNITTNSKAKSSEKLSSGYKINRAADDAAGLAISEKMRRQIRGLNQGALNTQDGISLLKVADGALNEVHDMLHRVTELSIQAANGTNTTEDREAIQQEVNQIISEINRISDTTTFNERKLFRGNLDIKGIENSGQASTGTGTAPSPSIEPQYRIEYETVEKDIYTPKQLNITITGIPEVKENRTYTVSANESGIRIGSDSIGWDSVKDIYGNSIDLSDVKTGSYSFSFGGMNINFDIDQKLEASEVASAIDGLRWSTKIVPLDSGLYYSMSAYMQEKEGTTSRQIRISAQDNGLVIDGQIITWDNFRDKNGNSLDKNNLQNESYSLTYDDVTYSLRIGPKNTADFSEIINTIPTQIITSTSRNVNYGTPINKVAFKSTFTPDDVNKMGNVGNKMFVRADEDGVWLQFGDGATPAYKTEKKSWEDMGLDSASKKLTYASNGIEFELNITQGFTKAEYAETIDNQQIIFDLTGNFSQISFKSGSSNSELSRVLYFENPTDASLDNPPIVFAPEDSDARWLPFAQFVNVPASTHDMNFRANIINSNNKMGYLYNASNGFTITDESMNALHEYFDTIRKDPNFNGEGIELEFKTQGGSYLRLQLHDTREDVKAGTPYSFQEFVDSLSGSKVGIVGDTAVFTYTFYDKDIVKPVYKTCQSINKTIAAQSSANNSCVIDKIENIPIFMKHDVITETIEVKIPIVPDPEDPPEDPSDPENKQEIESEKLNLWIQSGADLGDGMFITIGTMDADTLGMTGLDVTTEEGAGEAIEAASRATEIVSSLRSNIGAQQNRLEHTYKNVNNTAENTQASESIIRDTDMAKEMVQLSLKNILEQAGVSMMTQANQTNQGVLSLLQ